MNHYAVAAWNASWDASSQAHELDVPASHRAQALHSVEKQSTPPQDTTEPSATITNSASAPLARPLPAGDPLASIKAMTEEEKIALFT